MALSFASVASSASFPNLIQYSARPWLYELSQKYSANITLKNVPAAELTSLRTRGIDWFYLLGVWELGSYGLAFDRRNGAEPYRTVLPDCQVDDIIGSVFAVTNYTINPQIGTQTDLLNFRKTLSSYGMKLMLDFVPNHSALDSFLMNTPEYFIRAPQGTTDAAKYYKNGVAYGSAAWSDPWMDVAQLNYFEQKTRTLMSKYLMSIASLADGVRCDMAHVVLNDAFATHWKTELAAYGYSKPSTEFWPDAIASAKRVNPNLVVIAEVYGEDSMKTLQSLGFDYTYDKELFDRVYSGNINNIRGYITGNSLSFMQKNAHFVENHDDNRAIEHFGSWWKANAAAVIMFTVPGMKFSFQGQWVGKTYKLDVHLRRGYTEPDNLNVISFYDKLVPIVGSAPFKNGTFTVLEATNDSSAWKLLAWKWVQGSEKRLVVVNYGDSYASGAIKLTDFVGKGSIEIREVLYGSVFTRNAEEIRDIGLFVVLEPYQSQIFSYP